MSNCNSMTSLHSWTQTVTVGWATGAASVPTPAPVPAPAADSGKIAVFTYKLKAAQGDGSVYFKTQIRDEQGRWQVMNFRSAETALNTDVE